MKLKINYNGFHGHRTVVVQVRDEDYGTHGYDAPGYLVTRRQAVRVNRVVCGISGCRCGERIAMALPDPDNYLIPSERINYQPEGQAVAGAEINVRGHYPQSE